MPFLSFSGFLGYYILIFQLLFLLFLFGVFNHRRLGYFMYV